MEYDERQGLLKRSIRSEEVTNGMGTLNDDRYLRKQKDTINISVGVPRD